MARDFTLKLEKFMGLRNSADGSSELGDGESPDMLNFKITTGYKLQKRSGYAQVAAFAQPIRGIWHGEIGDEEYYCAAVGNALYVSTTGFNSMRPVTGALPGTEKVSFFLFCGILYLLTGAGIRKFNGTQVLELEPYIPLLMVGTNPNGSGTLFEHINVLTDHVRQTFTPDGESKDFYVGVPYISGIDYIKVSGYPVNANQYVWDDGKCCFSFISPPRATGTDSLEIGFQVDNSEGREKIHACRFAMGFGGANDTRVFLYGNRDYPAMRFNSGISHGEPKFEYFPETGYTLIGDGAPITSILRHYDRQLIFTKHAAYYSYLEYITEENNGKLMSSFPVFPLSADKGNYPEGQAVLVENFPCTVTETGFFRWESTNIRDERNAKCFSESIAQSLAAENLENAGVFNRKATSELYVFVSDRIYVYNYLLKVFYYYEGAEIGEMCEVGKELYFSGQQNKIYRVGGTTDAGAPIAAYWQSKKFDFSDLCRLKKITSVTLSAKNAPTSIAVVSWITEKCAGEGALTMNFSASGSDLIDTVSASGRIKARHFSLFGLTLRANGAANTLHVLDLVLHGQITDMKI